MQTSDKINEIAAALAKAQAEITNPAKDAQNPHYKSFYADLAAGIGAIRGPLTKHGIAVTQLPRLDGDVLMLDTRLIHSSGQWLQSEFPACRFPAKPQEVGSALTYARRYSLFAMVGIAGEDDDGEAANKHEIKPSAPKQATLQTYDDETSLEAFGMLIESLAMAGSITAIDKWRNDNIETITRLSTKHKDELRDALKKAKALFQQKEAA
jgi:hypothetical protein